MFRPMSLTANYTACSVKPTPNLKRYGASLEPVPSSSTAGHTACSVNGALDVLLRCTFLLNLVFHKMMAYSFLICNCGLIGNTSAEECRASGFKHSYSQIYIVAEITT